MPSPSKKLSKEEQKRQRDEKKRKNADKAARNAEKAARKEAEDQVKAAAIESVVSAIVKMKWPNHSLQQQEKREQTGMFGDGKKKVVWSEVYHPVKETVAAVLNNSSIKPKKTAKRSMSDDAKLVHCDSSHPLVPNFFGGQYSPFLPIAALGASITIGDRSSWTLGAMTLAGIVTAMQLNNLESGGKSLGGLKKSWEEQAFDSARDYLLAAVDNIGKLDVQKDGDEGGSDSENDDSNVDIYPRHFAKDQKKEKKKEATATERAIAILRAACPEQMEKLAELAAKDKYVGEAFEKMTTHNDAWGALRCKRSELKLLHDNPSLEGAFGTDGSEFQDYTIYMPWKKGVKIANSEDVADVFQDPKDLKKFYAWTDELREDGAEY